jgi:hypothetical protein
MNIKEQEIVEKYIAEATTSDYARLSTTELKDMLSIFSNVGRSTAKPVITAIKREMSRRLGEDYELEEAKVVPFKKLEQAWTRTNGDKDKQAKLIKKHDLKKIISTVRPGEIKLGVKNKLVGTTKAATAAGLDLDDELIFITNNPLKIIYPKKSTRRPEGEEIKEAAKVKKDLDTLRLEKVVSLTLKHDNMSVVEKFVASSNINLDSTAAEIKEATSGVKWVIYDEKTGKLLNKGKSYTTWKGAKSAAAKLPGKALPTDAAWYHDNKAKLMGEATELEEASATVQSVLKALRLKGGKDADALIKKMRDLGLESKVTKAHADAAKKILKGQITKFVKESKDLEEAIKWWTVTITKKAGKLFKGQTVDVKASNSAEAIKKGIKQMKGDPVTVPSGSVDAVLGESLKEAAKPSNGKSTVGIDVTDIKSAMKDIKKFKLTGKEGKGNGSAAEVIVTGKNADIFKYLTSKSYNMDTAEVEEFYPELYESNDLEEAVSQADIKKILAAAKKAGGDIKGNQIDFGMGAVIDVSIEKGKIKLDAGKSNGVEYFKTAKDAVMAFESVDFDLEEAFSRLPGNVINNELYVVNRAIQQFTSSQKNGDDVDEKKLNQLIKALQVIKKEVKQFNNPEDVPVKYQYKSK